MACMKRKKEKERERKMFIGGGGPLVRARDVHVVHVQKPRGMST